eukprot:Mrub_07454.p3 GENE.Mrub_07454~~Mrub_07454.p3  ORF type:complete len:171 (-),score=21.00 Mrub_07454:84-596(-)
MIVEPLLLKNVKDSNPGRMLFSGSNKTAEDVVGLSIQYADGDDCTFSKKRNVFVYAMCDETTEGDFSEVEGKGTCTYKYYLRTKYACGSFSYVTSLFDYIFYMVLLVGGYFGVMIFLNKQKGLKGTKMIPHYEWMKTLPKKLNGAIIVLNKLLSKINLLRKGKKTGYRKI